MSHNHLKLNVLTACILAIHSSLLVFACAKNSPTYNENGHLAAGVEILHNHSYSLYRVNPPLTKTVAAIPVYLNGLNVDSYYVGKSGITRYEHRAGYRLLELNPQEFQNFITLARILCIPFSILGAIACYLWTAKISNATGGLLALALWCFSPNILGHGALITPDITATSMALLACYVFLIGSANQTGP